MVRRHIAALMLALCGAVPPAVAQTTRDAALRVTVADQTGAVIVNAKVTVLPIDPGGAPVEIATDEHGEAHLTSLLPGRYAVRAEFPGFEPRP